MGVTLPFVLQGGPPPHLSQHLPASSYRWSCLLALSTSWGRGGSLSLLLDEDLEGPEGFITFQSLSEEGDRSQIGLLSSEQRFQNRVGIAKSHANGSEGY